MYKSFFSIICLDIEQKGTKTAKEAATKAAETNEQC